MPDRTFRGIDHIGITVPDIDSATQFLVEGLGGEVIYESYRRLDPPRAGAELEAKHGLAPGTQLVAQRLVKLGTGPDIELFEMHAPEQAQPARASDFGMTHLALYTEDIHAAVEQFQGAGGVMLSHPMGVGFAAEAGEGNTYCYGLTPWGMSIEFITLAGEMAYEQHTELRRWHRRHGLTAQAR